MALWIAILVIVIVEWVLETKVESSEPSYMSHSYSISYGAYMNDHRDSYVNGMPFPLACCIDSAIPAVFVGCSLLIALKWAQGK